MTRVVILQEYIPSYRVPFFTMLRDKASAHDIEIVVASGDPRAEQSLRGDAAWLEWFTPIKQRELSLFGRRIVFRYTRAAVAGADLLILEQARRNIDAYFRLVSRGKAGPSIALWGHGKDYTRPPKLFDLFLRRWLTLRADWFFAYTNGGASAVESIRFPPRRITVVQNSIDTVALAREFKGINPGDDNLRRVEEDLHGKTAIFLGALDDSKRLPFLRDACLLAHQLDPEFRLIIVGDGPLRSEVQVWASTFTWLHYAGSAQSHEKASLLAVSQVIAMPGAVGLVAVDSFAVGRPVITTEWSWHGPEFEYLDHGRNAIITENETTAYGIALLEALTNKTALTLMSRECVRDSKIYTVEAMTDNFLAGIRNILRDGRR